MRMLQVTDACHRLFMAPDSCWLLVPRKCRLLLLLFLLQTTAFAADEEFMQQVLERQRGHTQKKQADLLQERAQCVTLCTFYVKAAREGKEGDKGFTSVDQGVKSLRQLDERVQINGEGISGDCEECDDILELFGRDIVLWPHGGEFGSGVEDERHSADYDGNFCLYYVCDIEEVGHEGYNDAPKDEV